MNIPKTVSGRAVTPRGMHLHPNGLHGYVNDDYWFQMAIDMGMSWCVALTADDNFRISGAAEKWLQAGVIPIVRPSYTLPCVWTFQDETEELVDLYAKYNAPLVIQFANEVFDPREWVDGEVPPRDEAWAIIRNRWYQMAQLTIERGAIAGFPDGPCYGENPFLIIGDDQGWWADGNAVYLGHHYGKGRPLNYPYDDVTRKGVPLTEGQYREALDDFWMERDWMDVWVGGDPALTVELSLNLINTQRALWADPNKTAVDDPTCWLGWKQVEYYSMEAFGYIVDMAVTEGGWQPRDRAGSVPTDYRWAYTTPKMVAKKTLEMYNSKSPHFAICPWLLADGFMAGGDVGWPYDAWATWAFSEKYGALKPVIQTLIDNPPTPKVDVDASKEDFRKAWQHIEGMILNLKE